ncbi:hypothetical protein BGY98DRAFT_1190686 [Russula aff. rugulosa BPL654]|nr:hypothetical protein BGY98DRAFT_1190686 [Russula aff. rugulosa BPL654]
MSCYAIQNDVITTPKSEEGSWVNIYGESTSPGHKGVPPASTKDSTYFNVAGAGTTESSYHATSDRSYQGTPVDTTPNFSFSPTDVGYEEETSPTGPCENPGRSLFECNLCPERKYFTQRQVLLRHQREKHQPGFKCSHPDCDHVWTKSRKCEYRKHLRRKHGLQDDEIEEILAQPPVIISDDLPPHFPPPPIDAHHSSPPLVQSVATILDLRTKNQKLQQPSTNTLIAGFGSPGADIPPNPGMPHIPALPTQQPGTQWPWFSPPPQATDLCPWNPSSSYPALPPPTQQTPPALSKEMWDDTYPAVLGIHDHRNFGQDPLSQAVILTLLHRLAWAIGESAPVNESFKPWWPQHAATMLNTNDPFIAPYTARIVPSVQ